MRILLVLSIALAFVTPAQADNSLDRKSCAKVFSPNAIAACNRLLRSLKLTQEDRIKILKLRGMQHYYKANYSGAISDLSKIIVISPQNKFAIAYRGHSYQLLKKYNQAILDYSLLIKLNSRESNFFHWRGNSYYALKNYTKSIKDYTKAIRLEPKFLTALNNRGEAYRSIRSYKLAISDFDRIIRLSPNFATAYNGRGNVYSSLKQHKRAIADYSYAIKMNGRYAIAIRNRARNYHVIGEYTKMLEDSERLIRLLRRNPSTGQVFKAAALLGLKRPKEALIWVQKSLKRNPNSANSRRLRARIYEALNNKKKAISDYRRVLKLKPGDERSRKGLKRLGVMP